MFIAFEGPDNTGKSTSARMLTFNHGPIYQVSKETYEGAQEGLKDEPDLVQCFDRVVWLSHLVYRLALPDHEWNDPQVRTVFAMPDTHLVFKIHRPDLAKHIADELYTTGTLDEVNPMYYYYADFLMKLNRARGYALFKSVSIVEVSNDPRAGTFSQRLVAHESPAFGEEHPLFQLRTTLVDSDDTLLEFLRFADQNIG